MRIALVLLFTACGGLPVESIEQPDGDAPVVVAPASEDGGMNVVVDGNADMAHSPAADMAHAVAVSDMAQPVAVPADMARTCAYIPLCGPGGTCCNGGTCVNGSCWAMPGEYCDGQTIACWHTNTIQHICSAGHKCL